MKNLSSYNQDLSIPRKKDLDALKETFFYLNGYIDDENLSIPVDIQDELKAALERVIIGISYGNSTLDMASPHLVCSNLDGDNIILSISNIVTIETNVITFSSVFQTPAYKKRCAVVVINADNITLEEYYMTNMVDSVNGNDGDVILTAYDLNAVPTTRTINNKPLSSNITLTASDVGAQPKITVNGIVQGDGAGNLSAAELNPVSVGLGNVDNVKQYSATNPPPYPVTSVNGMTGAVTVSALPTVGTADNGKFLRVVNGVWAADTVPSAGGVAF